MNADESVDRKDQFDTFRAFRSIIFKENGNDIMVNASTDSKIQSGSPMFGGDHVITIDVGQRIKN